MQLANCTVKLGAKHYHSVNKSEVSAAEIQVLQAIHGSDAVENVTFAGESDRSAAEEKKHLETAYGNKDETRAIVDKLFPGSKPSLPDTLAEIGFDVDCTAAPKRAKPVAKEGDRIVPPRSTLRASEAALA